MTRVAVTGATGGPTAST